jgi:uncharacterized membrane protein
MNRRDMMDYAILKQKAREKLKGHWPTLIVITIIVGLVTSSDVNNSQSMARNGVQASQTFSTLINLIFGGPVLLGAAHVYLDLIRDNQVRIERFADGFKRFVDAFILNILIGLFVMLWTLLLIVPGIIAAIKYSMAYFIMSDNPDVKPLEAITMSKELMHGHKSEYFSFVLSFIGWFLLGIVTFGIGLLFLGPYFNASKAYFYKNLIGESDFDSSEYVVASKYDE